MHPARPARRRFAWHQRAGRALLALGLAVAASGAARAAPACTAVAWPEWSAFVRHFVQPDGRVVDASTPRKMSTSEGQSYAMFFALVANDRETFERLWRWSVANLAGGDTAQRLPAWSWGQRDDGAWGVLDSNAASDADLWFAYALLEAGRLWRQPAYTRDAQALLALIEGREVAQLPGLGSMLLPAPEGFAQPDLWRLNPSYLPVPVLRRLAQASAKGPWTQVANNTVRVIQATTPKGYAADWVAYRDVSREGGALGRYENDPVHGAKGSYDAIRTYLWAGMTPTADPAARPLVAALSGMATAVAATGAPPESVDVDSGQAQGQGPFGFSAALLPYFQARGQNDLLQGQLRRVRDAWAASQSPARLAVQQPPYYDYVLSLFGMGWFEQRYRFGATGRVSLEWEKKCP